MNQFLTANHYRRLPFVQATVIPFADDAFVDARLVLATALVATQVALTSLTRSGGSTSFVFTITGALSGYTLSGSVADGAAEDTRVILTLKDGSSTPRPDLGYGVVFIGSTTSLQLLGPSTSMSALLDPSTFRLNIANQVLTLRAGNMFRAGPATCDETVGAAANLALQGRVATILDGCVEVTTAPPQDITQEQMVPDVTGTSTTPVAVPPPVLTYTAYPNTTVTTITTHAVTINDTIPTSAVQATVAPVTRVLTEGHNAKLTGSLAEKLVTFGYKLNGGSGMDCDGVLGYSLGTLASDCVKSVNGVSAANGQLQLTAGAGVGFISDPAGHRILVLVNAENLTRAQP